MKLSAKARQSLNRVIEQFKAGDLSPVVEIARLHRKGDGSTELAEVPVPFDRWSFCNRIMAYIQTGSTDLRGYNQWREVGRQVKKGSRAAFILAPRFKKEKDENTGEEGQKMIGFLTIAVFPYHDTEGDPIPEHDHEPRELPPLANVAQRLGINVTWQPLPPDRLGEYRAVRGAGPNCQGDLSAGQISLGTHDASTFFHELAHAAHTKIDGPKKERGQDPHRETIADFTACVLMHLYGLGDRTGNTWRYIAGYHKDPLTAIMKALTKVEQVLALILDEPAEENQCPTPTA